MAVGLPCDGSVCKLGTRTHFHVRVTPVPAALAPGWLHPQVHTRSCPVTYETAMRAAFFMLHGGTGSGG